MDRHERKQKFLKQLDKAMVNHHCFKCLYTEYAKQIHRKSRRRITILRKRNRYADDVVVLAENEKVLRYALIT